MMSPRRPVRFSSRALIRAPLPRSSRPLTTTRALVSHAFYIGPSDQQCPDGSTVPALFWETLDANGRPSEEQLVVGAEHLQVLYGSDADGNGAVENYVNASDVANWDNITSVRFWLLVRADCREAGYTDTLGYDLPNGTYQPNDGYRRRLYHRVIALRNFL